MTEVLLSFAVQKLWDQLSNKYDKFQGIQNQVTALKTDLDTLKSLLKDADAKKHTSATVRKFLDEIKEIIFDAEDITETFILKEELGKHGGIKKRIRRFACICPERLEIALEIGRLSTRISKVNCEMEKYGVQKQIIADVRDPQYSQQRQENAREYENDIVGMDENVDELVGYLVEEDDVQVVSLTGMGGLGKTTLARQAFNHDKVKSKFNRLVWVCVSQDFHRMNVWQTMLLNLRPKNEENEIMQMNEARLRDELIRSFEASESLIVFDDIWRQEHWDTIRQIFPPKKGWKVLLTSRNENVARREDKTYINFKPGCLTMKDSWILFKRIAMPVRDASELRKDDEKMEAMGKQMMEHCGGLPLAIRVLGGLLAPNYTVHYWKRVSENIGSHLLGKANLNDEDSSLLNRILSLSYEELPGYLKYCFLYLAHFPEDYDIDIENLSYFWAADGRLMYNEGESIRDVGESYIEELARRNMVMSEKNNSTSRSETCRLHDLMRDLCLSKAKEENFLQILSPSTHPQSLSISRRFVSHDMDTSYVEREINNSKVRSFMVVCERLWYMHWKPSSLRFTRLQLLRVLHTPAAEFERGKLPYSIGKLIHLRYLHLASSNVHHLPSSLQNLKLLIYLDLDIVGPYVPHNLLMGMKELRYLTLPVYMCTTTRLELSHLVKLETLKNFSTANCNLEDLLCMGRLRTLGIELRGESNLESLSDTICGLRNLENLIVMYIGAKGTKEWRTLLDFSNLKQLKLTTEIPLISAELQFPSRLTSLTLSQSCLEKDPMPILEKLGQLKEVFLLRQSFCGRRMICSGSGFPQLRRLEIRGLIDAWEEWIIEKGSMPLLRILIISGSEKLKELPDGLRFIASLKYLSVASVPWKETLSEGGKDYHKVQHIPSVIIE